jgi:putative ABC transport system permease protein
VTAAGAAFRGSLAQNGCARRLRCSPSHSGVALGYAVQLINQAAINELAQGIHALSGDADLEVRGPRADFDEGALLGNCAAAGGGGGKSGGRGRREARRPQRIAAGARDRRVSRRLPPARFDPDVEGPPLDTLRSDALFVSAAARMLGIEAGDVVSFQVALAANRCGRRGLAAGGEQRFAVMDIAGAQAAFDRLSRVTRIDLRLRPGVDIEAFRERLRARLPPGIAAARPETGLAASASLSRSYRINLNVLALVAVFTGGLLVFSTQALAVVRRRAQLALLRVLGLTRRRLAALIAAEGALVGVAGSLPRPARLRARAGSRCGSSARSGLRLLPRCGARTAARSGRIGTFLRARHRGRAGRQSRPALETARRRRREALKAGDEERALHASEPPRRPAVLALAPRQRHCCR